MWDKLIPMICVLLVGTAWRQWEPGGIPIAQVRAVLNSLIINVLVPALILGVYLNAPPSAALFQVPVVATAVILGGMVLSMAWFGVMLRCGWISRAQAGAAVLASSVGNGLGAAVAAVDGLFAEGTGLTRVPRQQNLNPEAMTRLTYAQKPWNPFHIENEFRFVILVKEKLGENLEIDLGKEVSGCKLLECI